MFLAIAIVLLILWGGGFALHVLGGVIHIVLVLALISFIWHFIAGRKSV